MKRANQGSENFCKTLYNKGDCFTVIKWLGLGPVILTEREAKEEIITQSRPISSSL